MEKGLFAITNSSDTDTNNSRVWFFDPFTLVWMEIKQNLNGNQIAYDENSEFVSIFERIFTVQKGSTILELPFFQTMLESVIKTTLNSERVLLCSLCKEENLQNNLLKNQIPAEALEEFAGPLEFPFAAIGLLVDNTVLAEAKLCNIFFNYGSLGK